MFGSIRGFYEICKRSYYCPTPDSNPQVKFRGIFINNEWCTSRNCEVFDTINPSTGEKIATIHRGGDDDIHAAVCAAYEAFEPCSPWRKMDASDRGRILYTLADFIEMEAVYLASLETLDNGKPFRTAYGFDVPHLSKCLRYYAGYADKKNGNVVPVDGNFFAYTRHEPVGVCAQIISSSFPMVMMGWKIAPALAMGNTVVLKPSEVTPLTALYIAHLAKESGLPPGVLNVVPGCEDAGEALAKHPLVDKIAFTGSTEVGLKIQQQSGICKLKRTTLELAGKNPNIILADADICDAVEVAHQGAFFNQGQVRSAGSRVYIQESIYDEFVERSVARATKRIVGDPFCTDTEQGPQISKMHMDKVLSFIDTAIKEGAKLLVGGKQLGEKGFFIEPTVFVDIKDCHKISREVVFGPVQQLMKFGSLDEVIERANDTNYGLAAAVFSKNVDNVNYLVQRLKAGTVWVNCYNALGTGMPFGGYKDSGHGRELGEYGLRHYTEIKSVIQKVPAKIS